MTPLILLDSIETCLSLEPLRTNLFRLGLGDSHLELWFARALRDAFAREVVGAWVPFRRVLIESLDTLLISRGKPAQRVDVEATVDLFGELPPHADVRPALERAQARGLRVAVLTNGAEKSTRKAIDRAILLEYIERIISIDEVGHFKPAREVYLHAAQVLDVPPEQCVMVAAHGWDLRGALRAGMRAAFIQRNEAITTDLASNLAASRPSLDALIADLGRVNATRRSA
jgi:2-haloacid dehalogenase